LPRLSVLLGRVLPAVAEAVPFGNGLRAGVSALAAGSRGKEASMEGSHVLGGLTIGLVGLIAAVSVAVAVTAEGSSGAAVEAPEGVTAPASNGASVSGDGARGSSPLWHRTGDRVGDRNDHHGWDHRLDGGDHDLDDGDDDAHEDWDDGDRSGRGGSDGDDGDSDGDGYEHD
jgi:hypothetical protein